eukprot:g11573.t1
MQNKQRALGDYASTRPIDRTLDLTKNLPTSNTGQLHEESRIFGMSEPFPMKLLHMVAGIIPAQRDKWYLYVFPALIWLFNMAPLSIHLLLSFNVSHVKRYTAVSLDYTPTLTQNLSGIFLYTFLYGVQYSLYRTRTSFIDKIQHFASKQSVADHSRRTLITCVVTGLVLAVVLFFIYIVTAAVNVAGIFWLLGFSFLTIVPIMAVVGMLLLRALAFDHIFSKQYKKLKSMAKESDANKVHTTFVSMADDVTKHFSAYLDLPLKVCVTLAFLTSAFNVMSIYGDREVQFNELMYEITFAFLPSIIIVVPCHILVKLDLQAFEVKEILCKNSLMNRTDFTALLLSYELIVPQPKLFGMKVTFGLVASLVVPMIGALVPRLVQWLMDAAY